MPEQRRSRATEAFFGRRRGKGLKPAQAEALSRLLPALRIDLAAPAPGNPAALFGRPVEAVCLEIGFGGGEHLFHEAEGNRDRGFIGVEPFVNGMAKLLGRLSDMPLDNIRLHDDDATVLLDWLPSGFLDRIDLLYPDPWPKRRHWKRRFVNPANLDRFARVLKSGGRFRFASDMDSYVDWTLLHCRSHRAFEWEAETADDWRRPYPGWPGTRYEAKAIREGRIPAYLGFVRL